MNEQTEDDMKLPEGFTCMDCVLFNKCVAFGIASASSQSTSCDWSPSKFMIHPEKTRDLIDKKIKMENVIADLKADSNRLATGPGRLNDDGDVECVF